MADKIPALGNYVIPSYVYDLHEWMADAYIDGETGRDCILIYPDKWTECDNCYIDTSTNRSSSIYKAGGPAAFPANTICPRCNGEGRSQTAVTATIRMRVYWDKSSWVDIGAAIANPTGVAMCIGYIDDLPKLERATRIILNHNVDPVQRLECTREGEAKPWGFRGNRYFIQYVRRTGSG